MRQVENMDEAAKAMALKALEELQEQMRGEAEKAGLRTEEDVIRLVKVKEIRHEDIPKPEVNDENQ
jgi:hypothetical protein